MTTTRRRIESLERRKPQRGLVLSFAGMYDQNAPGAWQRPTNQTFEQAYRNHTKGEL